MDRVSTGDMPRTYGDFNVTVDYALVRPPTVAYRERDAAAAWREMEFPATVSKGCKIRLLNLHGAFPEIGALEELILPIGQGIKSGAFGQLMLGIISSDEPVIHYVESIAEKHGIPLFVSHPGEDPLGSSSPVGKLTALEMSTLEAVQELGGRVTSSELAKTLDLELAAAGNRLAKIEKKGYLLRIPRSPREGDIYIDPRQALNIPLPTNRIEATAYIPPEIRDAVTVLAEKQGRSANDVLGEVWSDFIRRNKKELGQDFMRISKLFDSGDTKGLEEQLTSDADDWAEQAATAWEDA